MEQTPPVPLETVNTPLTKEAEVPKDALNSPVIKEEAPADVEDDDDGGNEDDDVGDDSDDGGDDQDDDAQEAEEDGEIEPPHTVGANLSQKEIVPEDKAPLVDPMIETVDLPGMPVTQVGGSIRAHSVLEQGMESPLVIKSEPSPIPLSASAEELSNETKPNEGSNDDFVVMPTGNDGETTTIEANAPVSSSLPEADKQAAEILADVVPKASADDSHESNETNEEAAVTLPPSDLSNPIDGGDSTGVPEQGASQQPPPLSKDLDAVDLLKGADELALGDEVAHSDNRKKEETAPEVTNTGDFQGSGSETIFSNTNQGSTADVILSGSEESNPEVAHVEKPESPGEVSKENAADFTEEQVAGVEGSGGGLLNSALNWLGLNDKDEALVNGGSVDDAATTLQQQIAMMDPSISHGAGSGDTNDKGTSVPVPASILEAEPGYCHSEDCGKLAPPVIPEPPNQESFMHPENHAHDHQHTHSKILTIFYLNGLITSMHFRTAVNEGPSSVEQNTVHPDVKPVEGSHLHHHDHADHVHGTFYFIIE